MNPTPHFISVVIPTSGRRSLQRVKDALALQIRAPDELTIVEDRDRRGPGWARNRGVELSRGDIIAFIDDDTLPPPEWLKSMVDALDETGCDIAGGSFIETDPILHAVRSTRPIPTVRVVDGFGLVGNSGNLVVRRHVLDMLMARDGYLMIEEWGAYGSEDWEMMMRIRQAGFRAVYVPVHMQHLRRVTFASYMRHQYKRGIGVALLHKAIRRAGLGASPQQSILWDPERSRAGRLLGVLKSKVIGPLNASLFESRRHFLIHWAAEKFQSIGYLWGVIRYGR
jgi:glycosyltransferase involved in cell wall biosynthesis